MGNPFPSIPKRLCWISSAWEVLHISWVLEIEFVSLMIGVRDMQQGKVYSDLDMVFSFVATTVGIAVGSTANTWMMEVQTIYYDLASALLFSKTRIMVFEKGAGEVADTIGEMQKCAVQLFGILDESHLSRLKSHFLYQVPKSFLSSQAFLHLTFSDRSTSTSSSRT